VIGGLLRILVIALIALVAAMMLLPRPGDLIRDPETATVLDVPRPLPDVALIDADGEPFSISSLAGRETLVFFGFTNCPDICPLTLAQIARALGMLRERAPNALPQVLFVSVDPARDTPERIRSYVTAFDSEMIGVTADDATLAPLLSALGVTVHRETQGDATYNVVHNGTIYVLDRNASWLALFGGSSHQAETIASDYLAIRARNRGG